MLAGPSALPLDAAVAHLAGLQAQLPTSPYIGLWSRLARFTHVGLVPAAPCYEFCEPAWQHYITSSLRGMLASEHAA